MARRQKLIRNLRPGDEILVYDATKYPSVRHRVRITHVQETSRNWFDGRRQWRAYFEPHLFFDSWCFVTGQSRDKIEVVS